MSPPTVARERPPRRPPERVHETSHRRRHFEGERRERAPFFQRRERDARIHRDGDFVGQAAFVLRPARLDTYSPARNSVHAAPTGVHPASGTLSLRGCLTCRRATNGWAETWHGATRLGVARHVAVTGIGSFLRCPSCVRGRASSCLDVVGDHPPTAVIALAPPRRPPTSRERYSAAARPAARRSTARRCGGWARRRFIICQIEPAGCRTRRRKTPAVVPSPRRPIHRGRLDTARGTRPRTCPYPSVEPATD